MKYVESHTEIHQNLNKEAIRLIQLTSGDWNPGKDEGKAVSMKYYLPITLFSSKKCIKKHKKLVEQASIEFSNKRYNEALNLYSQVLNNEPTNREALKGRINVYEKLNKDQEACLDRKLLEILKFEKTIDKLEGMCE